MKRRFLLVGDYNRNDFLEISRQLKEVDFYFIEHINAGAITNKEAGKSGTILFWKDFKSAFDLLDQVRPDKVLFYFIESFNHVALNAACKIKGVPTYHLEHGLRFALTSFLDVPAGS
ncbi:MAG TPA: hypothetical protein VHK69_19145, partial [Chitinophagaceae bacterium]|nr:hypothetical protein [Chitinophagaceae bacterium]